MAIIIITLLLLGYLLIATERLTNINKAAVAMFIGTLGWVLYICYGNDFVMSQHPNDYFDFLDGDSPTGIAAKQYIAQNVFLKYVGKASEIVLFLLATMSIVEILQNNGCFDFISQLMRTRSSRRLLWSFAMVTFLISANLDNLTTTVMMLTIMHKIVTQRRLRMVYGSVIVLSANCGGALTVIGDPVGLVLWSTGAVTATNFSMSLAMPCLAAWLIPTCWLGRTLPDRVEIEWITMPYRGDDTNLNAWQRLLMLFVGIGGLWFIPTFHNMTQLSPFLGALCVLSVLWIVNEVVNRKLMNNEEMIQRRIPRVLQYGVIQLMLFVMGMMLAVGAARESGALNWLEETLGRTASDLWIVAAFTTLVSTAVNSFATALSMFSLADLVHVGPLADSSAACWDFVQNAPYWKVVAYASAVGGNLLAIGSSSGLALLKMERIHVGWYFRNVGVKALVGGLVGFALLWLALSGWA